MSPMRARAALLLALWGCNAIAGVNDFQEVDCAGGQCADASVDASSRSADASNEATPLRDGGADALVDSATADAGPCSEAGAQCGRPGLALCCSGLQCDTFGMCAAAACRKVGSSCSTSSPCCDGGYCGPNKFCVACQSTFLPCEAGVECCSGSCGSFGNCN